MRPRIRSAAVLAAKVRSLDQATVRAAVWTVRELRRLRRTLGPEGLNASVRRPPDLPASGVRGVKVAARIGRATCLERSLLLQAWSAAHGRPLDILVGVDTSGDGFAAHAWIPEYDGQHPQYTVIRRRSAA